MPVNRAKFHFDNTYAGMDMLYGPYVLYQIGDLSCEAGYQTFEHEQAVYEITYVLSGTGAFYVDDMDAALALHKEMNCVCFENPAMGIYFINDPDNYWIEIIPAR